MKTCKFCGRLTENKKICDKCKQEIKGKSLREFFNEEQHIFNLLSKDCLECPIKETDFCNMLYENPQNEEEERQLCSEYLKKWFDFTEKNKF